jgi:hypothetical protein
MDSLGSATATAHPAASGLCLEDCLVNRLYVMFGMIVLATAVLVGSGYSQDTKKETQPAAKVQLPTGWGKLGIVGDQKKKILDVVGNYQGKIAALKDQMDALKKAEYAEAYNLLNDDQKTLLKKIAAEKTDPGKDDKKDDKKKSSN